MESTMKRQKLSTIQLEDLPVEVLLNVLNFLELPDLNRFGQVSKRLKSASLVESLWQKIILLNKTVSINLVEKILDRGCKTLCLKSCMLKEASYLLYILDQPFYQFGKQVKADKKPGSSQLINLDLYHCELTHEFLETLLSSSHYLKTFSLTDYNINRFPTDVLHMFYSQNGKTLQTLNLAFTRVLSLEHIELIVKNCTVLKEVDFSDCCLSIESIHLLAKGITKSIEKFDLAYCSLNFTDAADWCINILVSRCNKIKSLNLAWNFITDKTLINIKKNLKNTLEELDISMCSNITNSELLEMRSMPKNKILNYFRPLDSNYEDLKKNLPQLTNIHPKEKWKGWYRPRLV